MYLDRDRVLTQVGALGDPSLQEKTLYGVWYGVHSCNGLLWVAPSLLPVLLTFLSWQCLPDFLQCLPCFLHLYSQLPGTASPTS